MRQRPSTSAKAPYLFFLLPVLMMFCFIASPAAQPASAPLRFLKTGQAVDWWFVFKFNAESFPDCGGPQRACPFGGTVQAYTHFSQQFGFASSADQTLRQGGGCLGATTGHPFGGTFSEEKK